MLELGLIAYFLSIISLACNIWMYSEIREMKQDKKRELVQKRLKQLTKPIQTVRPKGYWDNRN